MAANRTDSYNPGFSTYCILYNVENGLPRISTRHGQTFTVTLPQGISRPINICSSSDGLIACHDPISNSYYIGNPNYPDSYIPLPQTPRPHDPQHTHVVLATDFLVPPPIYHLICAVEDSIPTRYTFDTYSSCIGHWRSDSGIDVRGHIIPYTGVSCGAYAYWLTEAPRSITQFNVYTRSASWKMFLDNVIPSVPETRIQLGRIANELALLSVSVEGSSYPRVTLYSGLEEGNPVQLYSGNLQIPNPSQSIPRPIRFHSYYVEVFFWANGKLILWENNTINSGTASVQMLNEEGAHAAVGIADISTTFRPENFLVSSLGPPSQFKRS